MIKKNIELLAPAEVLKHTELQRQQVQMRYLGAKAFNARANASNFDNKALSEVIKDAHIRGIKIYLVLNTLISDKELKKPKVGFFCI